MVALASTSIPVLPYVNTSGRANIAKVVCDSGAARQWIIGLAGSAGQDQQVTAQFLVVDNSANAASCYVDFSNFRFSVSPYTRKSFKLPEDQVSIALTVGTGAVGVTISDVDLGIPDDSSQYGAAGVAGSLDKSAFDPSSATSTAVAVDSTGFIAQFNGNSNAAVLSKTNKTFGKYYIEVIYDSSKNNGLAFVPFENLAVGSSSPGSTGVFFNCPGNGQILSVYTYGRSQGVAVINGLNGSVKMAIDLDNGRLWVANQGSSTWNGDATTDPSKPSSGFDCSAIFANFKKINFQACGATAGNVQVNTGASPFADVPPVGYTNGW